MNVTLINTADIIIIAFTAFFAYRGWRRGLIHTAVGLLSLVASIALACILYPILSDIINASPLGEAIYNGVLKKLSENTNAGGLMLMPDSVKGIIDSGANTVTDVTALTITKFAVNILSFISVLIVSRIIIAIVARVLNLLSKVPLIALPNRFMGMLLGIIKALAVVYIVLALISGIIPTEENRYIFSIIDGSAVAKYMYNQNPICMLLSRVTGV